MSIQRQQDPSTQGGALLDAVIDNNLEQVETLLAQGANPNYFEDSGHIQPLHFAAVYNATDVIYTLVKHGANIHATTSDGLSPLALAAQLKHSDIEKKLINFSKNLHYLNP